MKISNIIINNYRTIENIELLFSENYSAISGKNNSGKSNVIKAIRSFFEDAESNNWMEDFQVNLKKDFPNWKTGGSAQNSIVFKLDLLINETLDAGLHRYITTFIGLEQHEPDLEIRLEQSFGKAPSSNYIRLYHNGNEIKDRFKVDEIFKKLKASRCLIFHNSTQSFQPYFLRPNIGKMFGDLSLEETEKLKKANQQLYKLFQKSAQRHQKDALELLGRLEEKYDVTLSVPPLQMESIPFTVSLGDKNNSVQLNDWGSGTQNRTQILLSLLKAKKNREGLNESDKITPVLVIEEPECFLHPSAQAEFGKMLQDLSEELNVQVITTTHSPYMLSLSNPNSNILLRRKSHRKKLMDTELVEINNDNWMEPFGLSLGIDNDAFSNWRHVLFKNSNELILVEGEIDKEYLEMLRDEKHGNNRLHFGGEIFAYGGSGFLENTILVKFLIARFTKLVITYDLDCDAKVSGSLLKIGLKKGVNLFSVGIDKPAKRNIEGLLPEPILSAVYSKHASLVTIATSAEKDSKSAKQSLKRHLLTEFKSKAKPGDEYFKEFYKLTKVINKVFK